MKKSWWGIFLGIAFLLAAAGCGGGGGGGGGNSDRFTVGGTVSGLTEGSSVVLQLNGADDITVGNGEPFTFSTSLANGASYEVTVKAQPDAGRFCSVANGSGTINGANVTSVLVNGQLDNSFGAHGIVVGANVVGGSGDDLGHAVTLDASGRVLVGGESENSSGKSDMAVWRYTADGELDNTFGGGDGIASYDGDAHGDDAGYAITVDASGNILVTGVITNASGNFDMAVWRFTDAGVLDASFGGGTGDPDAPFGGGAGFVTYHNPAYVAGSEEGRAILLDADGNILVAGSQQNSSGDSDMAIWRLSSSGDPDSSFGSAGIVSDDNSSIHGNDAGTSMDLDASGNIYVAGGSMNISGNLDMRVWRYSSAGILDMLFGGGDGYVLYDGSHGNDWGSSIVLSSGKITVAGYSMNSSGDYDMMVWRYLTASSPQGQPDSGFGTNGSVRRTNAAGGNGDDYGFSLKLDNDGKILVAGTSRNVMEELDMALWRFTTSGQSDSSFGWNGVILSSDAAGKAYFDCGTGIALDSAGKILVSGYGVNASDNFDMVVWRYFP